MVIDFSIKNFRSIRDLQTISFAATGLVSNPRYSDIDNKNITEIAGLKLLKTVGLYGANASGKSNVLKALEAFFLAVRQEASPESKLETLHNPYLYQHDAEESESFFQINLIINEKRYRYGFTVRKNEDSTSNSKHIIASEWLFGQKEKNMVEIFTRRNLSINKEKLVNKEAIPPLQFEHTLFLTHAAAFDKASVMSSVREHIKQTISNIQRGDSVFRIGSLFLIEKMGGKQRFLDLMSAFGLNYDDVIIERDEDNKTSTFVSSKNIYLKKLSVDSDGNCYPATLNLERNESEGTRKMFDLSGTLLSIFALKEPGLFVLDEIDNNFHPSLLIHLIKLFNDPTVNKNNSQLLFTSHDTNLMKPSLMRRDQFYFAEKQGEATSLHSLSDLKGIRNDADFARLYLSGLLGGKPSLRDYSSNQTDTRIGALES